MAFTRSARVAVWIDKAENRLVINSGNAARADEVVTSLVKSLDGFAVALINTQIEPASRHGRTGCRRRSRRPASPSTASASSRPPTNPRPWCATPSTRWTSTR